MSAQIISLPTAAPRRVKQQENKEARQARRALREQTGWTAYVSPQMRLAKKRAVILDATKQTPALLIVAAMLSVMPDEERQAVADKLASMPLASDAYAQALLLTTQSRMRFADAFDLQRALCELRGV